MGADGLKSLVFKELSLQSIRKTILSAPGLARAGSLSGAGFGLAPCFYSIGCVKGFAVREEHIPGAEARICGWSMMSRLKPGPISEATAFRSNGFQKQWLSEAMALRSNGPCLSAWQSWLVQGVGDSGDELEAVVLVAGGGCVEVAVGGAEVEAEAVVSGQREAGGEVGGVGAEVVEGGEEAA